MARVVRKPCRQPEQGHLAGTGRRVDVGVGGKGQRAADRPRLAPPDLVEKGEGAGAYDGRHIRVAKRQAEVVARPAVLAGLEIGEGEVETHPWQVGIAGQHGAETIDGSLPFAALERDRAVQEVEVVDVPFAGLDAFENELGIVQFALRKRRARRLHQVLRSQSRGLLLLRIDRPDSEGANQEKREDHPLDHADALNHVHTLFGCIAGLERGPSVDWSGQGVGRATRMPIRHAGATKSV